MQYPEAKDLEIKRTIVLRYDGRVPSDRLKTLIEHYTPAGDPRNDFYRRARDELGVLDQRNSNATRDLSAGLEWANQLVNYEIERNSLKRKWSKRVCGIEFRPAYIKQWDDECYRIQRECNVYSQSKPADVREATLIGIQELIHAAHRIKLVGDERFVVKPGLQ